MLDAQIEIESKLNQSDIVKPVIFCTHERRKECMFSQTGSVLVSCTFSIVIKACIAL